METDPEKQLAADMKESISFQTQSQCQIKMLPLPIYGRHWNVEVRQTW